MGKNDVPLFAHLMRRAGFGANHEELIEYANKGYEASVEDLLNPLDNDAMSQDVIRRYHVDQSEMRHPFSAGGNWIYRMVTTSNPLEEKIALFWHSLFATGYSKLNQSRALMNQIDTFRKYGLGPFNKLLVELSKDPAMLIWLDNNENHKGATNENYGRELLELFSMGIGNYDEQDVKECARAFTGWTIGNVEYMSVRAMKDSLWPYGRISWHFQFIPSDHDEDEKIFLGAKGNFDGGDIIDIIACNEATARFLTTRLYQFFVADKVDEIGTQVINEMTRSYFESGYEVRSVLRTLFNSDYFKSDQARYARVKSPVEQVVGAIRLAGSYRYPTLGIEKIAKQAFYMGQGLLMPPTVEGWHEGIEWIDSGALMERVNFAANELANPSNPGVYEIIQRLSSQNGGSLKPDELVNGCLHLMGEVEVDENTRTALIGYIDARGKVDFTDRRESGDDLGQCIGEVLGLIASTREYQLA